MISGWKTITGAAFLAITALVSGLEPVLSPETLLVIKAVTGAAGAFLTAVGLGHKVDKITK